MDANRLPLHILQQSQLTCSQHCSALRQRLQHVQAEVDALRQRYEDLTRIGADLRIAIDRAVSSSWDSHLRERWRNAAEHSRDSASTEELLGRLVASLVHERQLYSRKIAELEAILEEDRRLRETTGQGEIGKRR